MIEIKKFSCNILEENCYVVSDDTKECVVIDCGAYEQQERDAIVNYIRSNQLTPVHLLATHGHLDHNFGNNTMSAEFALKPEIASGDAKMMENLAHQAEQFYGIQLNYDMPPIGHIFDDNEIIEFGHHKLQVMPTPGHSRGSVCFYCSEENTLFSGDTLFHQSIGRTDFTGGSMLQIIQSLRMLAQLPDNTQVLPGHGLPTTIGQELAHNPYMDR